MTEVDDKFHPITWPSMAHLWSDWYNRYKSADYPRLIVRFEDLLFHAKELVQAVCECGGAVPIHPQATFTYVVGESKYGSIHKGSSNLVTAMIKYGTDRRRLTHMTKEDLKLAHEALDSELMEFFQYLPVPVE